MIDEMTDAIVARAQQLWVEALPDAEVPECADFFKWLHKSNGDADTLFRAIARTGRKSVGAEMSSEDCRRYCTSTVIHGATGKLTAPENTTVGRAAREWHTVNLETSLFKRSNGDTLEIRATGRARKATRNGIGRLA